MEINEVALSYQQRTPVIVQGSRQRFESLCGQQKLRYIARIGEVQRRAYSEILCASSLRVATGMSALFFVIQPQRDE